MSQNCCDGLRWNSIVKQPGTKATAERMESVPVDARALEFGFDVLGAERCQVEREDLRPFSRSLALWNLDAICWVRT